MTDVQTLRSYIKGAGFRIVHDPSGQMAVPASQRDALNALAGLERCQSLLQRMLDPGWWREEVDVNGEYTTTRARGYYECVGEIREALAPFVFGDEEPSDDGGTLPA